MGWVRGYPPPSLLHRSCTPAPGGFCRGFGGRRGLILVGLVQVNPLCNLVAIILHEALVLAHHSHGGVLLIQLHPLRAARGEGVQAVHHKLLQGAALEVPEVLLEVRLCGLRAGADGDRLVVVEVPRRAGLVQHRPSFVIASDQEPHAVRPPVRHLGVFLGLVRNPSDQPLHRNGGVVDKAVVDALRANKTGENPGIRGQPRNGHSHVGVQLEKLGLIRAKLGLGCPLQRNQDNVILGLRAHGAAALLHGLHGVVHLEEPAVGRPCRDVIIVLAAEHPRGTRDTFSLNALCRETLSLTALLKNGPK
eukprot:RCo019834